MNPPNTWTSFDPATELEIGDRGKILLAKMLPGCTARRFDLPDAPGDYWDVQLCFADQTPIVPQISVWHRPPYYMSIALYATYSVMLQDPRVMHHDFLGPRITMAVPLDIGPEAIAARLFEAVAKFDLAGMIAAGSIERIFAEQPRYEVPWPNLGLAICAIYLGRDDEARELLQNALKYADQKGREYYGTLAPQAETYLSKLNADADLLRQELHETMNYNWSHFKPISP